MALLVMMFGDFNSVRTHAERVDSDSFDVSSAVDFNECLEDIDMEDMASKGFWFTWTNRRVDLALYRVELTGLQRRIPFKFFSFWMNHKNFPDVLLDAWSRAVHGNPMDALSQKLRKLKLLLKDFNKEFYRDIQKRVALVKEELSSLQVDALLKYSELVVVEEGFHRQISRVQWLALGDQNSKFFHKKVKSHIVRSKILSISDENGWAYSRCHCIGDQKGYVRYNGDKAPGPNGFNASFFHKNWSIVGLDVVNVVTYFFTHKCLPKGWNATALTLVPKLSCPLTMKDYRPIACCNVIYKCITKLLALRLQPILPHLIDQSQAAFVKDDLFLMSSADCGSLCVYKSALDEFYLFSGFKPNLQRSQIFFSGFDEDLKGALLDILPIPEGHLPVRYLGVPLISSRLRHKEGNTDTISYIIAYTNNNTLLFLVIRLLLHIL
ncbi:uncharacterized protein LOC131302856 [Rhododendron vialii]|uniref:uncharacterized protein LOC131302856 n=1 Tax=Rhododendron vialii TaxID=182163 RepID=UPI00265D839B|nr:uncharacterized protein LOC131302856 [Rhododendron vialii]